MDRVRGVREILPELVGHPDRLRWNAKYEAGAGAEFRAHWLAQRALEVGLPDGAVLDLASGPSGSALLAAEGGRRVVAVDVAEVALELLDQEARRRGVRDLITLVHADLGGWRPEEGGFALVLCTGYWDRAVFHRAVDAVMSGGLLGWEAFTADARRVRPSLPEEWCLGAGEPASLLPDGFVVLDEEDLPDSERGAKRRLLTRRGPSAS